MSLEVDVRVRRGVFALDVALTAGPGKIVAVLGPNGAGKSTLLDVIGGLLLPVSGSVRVGSRVLTTVGAEGRVHVRPDRRSVGLLGQDPLVFPHLDARENVAFGPRAAGSAAAAARTSADAWLTAVGLDGLGDRRPRALSGGQRQRVALARALAAEPAALLLDEPFAQLDVRTAAELRDVVRDQVRRTQTPTVLVTHSVLDALTLADEVVVLDHGTVVERGHPLDVLTDPAHPFTAALAGVNLVVGEIAAGPVLAGPDGLRLPCRTELPVGTPAQASFAPTAVSVAEPDADDLVWTSHVVDLETGTTGVRVRTTGDVLVDLAPTLVGRVDLQVGAPVRLAVPASAVRVRRRA
ncbi:ABC transporter ATP-binding protein [Cellulomonas sp.]|uniref:sulfate/molybdate ABC transporter ATP-binding protein n=1 Tax=Cellulomonas sp. TaxID=40001 RepID=UPI001AFCED12|nr:ABC transporter ATP-binding protein [Cellulomonas sp.]MBO9555343.1 ABC transporter ATP-binding protein [Cellulomonas sp.]